MNEKASGPDEAAVGRRRPTSVLLPPDALNGDWRHGTGQGTPETEPGGDAMSPPTPEQDALLLQKLRWAKRQRSLRAMRRSSFVIGTALSLGVVAGATVMAIADAERPFAGLRTTLATWLMPDDAEPGAAAMSGRPSEDSNETRPLTVPIVAPPRPTPAPIETGWATANDDVEARLLAMLEASNLALRQLQALERLRAAEIGRMSAVPATSDDPEGRIFDMVVSSGALDATLASLPQATNVSASVPRDIVAGSRAQAGDPDSLLAQLAALETARTQLIAELVTEAAADPDATSEVGSLAALERGLRVLLTYVQEVELVLADEGDPTAVTAPNFAELEALVVLEPDLVPLDELVERTVSLRAALSE